MKRLLITIATLALFLAADRPATAQTNTPPSTAPEPATNDATRLDFASFQMIAEHNIFDPNRRQRSTRREPTARPVQVDYFTLNGISEVNRKPTAFFTGTSSLLNGRFTIKDTIGGYKIVEIDPGLDYVKLGADSNSVVKLEILDQMRRYDRGPWSLVHNAPTEPETKTAVAVQDSTSSNSPTVSSAGSDDDIVKKLMRRREKEPSPK